MVGCDLPRSAAVTHEFYVLWYAKQRTWYPLIKFYVHQMALEVRITLTTGYTEAHAILLSLAESSRGYQGETLSFETPGAFFSRLTERR